MRSAAINKPLTRRRIPARARNLFRWRRIKHGKQARHLIGCEAEGVGIRRQVCSPCRRARPMATSSTAAGSATAATPSSSAGCAATTPALPRRVPMYLITSIHRMPILPAMSTRIMRRITTTRGKCGALHGKGHRVRAVIPTADDTLVLFFLDNQCIRPVFIRNRFGSYDLRTDVTKLFII
ncbi:unnamed protein product [Cuscuta campestris]|uniref:Uncharacterized protein n=1 Tax=Cuscuta campestris TaxID=132261 RepID=A0A484MHX3_9ASTE|nr:unnamed protein product [Cuscuta campestris]